MTFYEMVAGMRRAQREYFRTRSSTALRESMRLEKLVDKALADHDKPALFDKDDVIPDPNEVAKGRPL